MAETGEVEETIEVVEAGEAGPEPTEAVVKVVAAPTMEVVKIVVKETRGPPEDRSIVQFRIPLLTSYVIVIMSMRTKHGTA